MQQYIDTFGYIKNYNPHEVSSLLLIKELFGTVPKDHRVLQEKNGLGWIYTYMVNSDGQKNGYYVSTYENNLIEINYYTNNTRNGKFYSWNHNGSRKSETLFINDIPHGYYTQWNEDNQIMNITRYDSGYFDGFHIEYNHETNDIDELTRYKQMRI